MQKIAPSELIDMTPLEDSGLCRIELAYALGDNLLLGEKIYRDDARLYLHKILAGIIEGAAKVAAQDGYRLVLYDGLRTTTAQARMLTCRRVIENPQWLQEPRLLSPPGAGAHPRGMAIDVSLETPGGPLLDMGTPFDYLASDPSPQHNPAHRQYHALQAVHAQNRALLDFYINSAAEAAGHPILPLPQEWWDYRLPPSLTERYAPLSDDDLPAPMRMCP